MPTVVLKPNAISGHPYPSGNNFAYLYPPDDDNTTTIGVIKASVSGQVRDYFNAAFEDFPTSFSEYENPTIESIDSIVVRVRGMVEVSLNSGLLTISNGLGDSGGNNLGIGSSNNTWATFTKQYSHQSNGSAWTEAAINALTVHITPAVNDWTWVSTLTIEVNFTVSETPNDPSGLAITDEAYNFVKLEWNDNSAIETGFEVQRSPDGSIWSTIATVGANVETYTDNTVHSSTIYQYRVRAINDLHASDWTSTVTLTTDAPSGPPGTPTGLVSLNKTPTTIPVAWFVDDDLADYFEVQRSADAGATWIETVQVSKEVQYHTFSVLPGSTYSFRVRGVNSAGNSSYSSTLTETAPEREFRSFLENEVLQDVARYLGWKDRYYVTDQTFTVHQQIPFVPNITNEELHALWQIVHWNSSDSVTTQRYGQLGAYIMNIGVAGQSSAIIPPYTTTIKLASPLVMDVPKGTVFWTRGDGLLRFLVGNETLLTGVTDDDLEYFDAPVTQGAPVGETIIQVDYQIKVGGTWQSTVPGYPMGPTVTGGAQGMHGPGVVYGLGRGTLTSGTFDVTQTVDPTVDAFNAQPIYDGITTDALLRLGYTREIDVPASEYQQFRDAGKVEAWRAVAYATIDKQKVIVEGTFKSLSDINSFAIDLMKMAEDEYVALYEPTIITPTLPAPKIRGNSYSGQVEVRF